MTNVRQAEPTTEEQELARLTLREMGPLGDTLAELGGQSINVFGGIPGETVVAKVAVAPVLSVPETDPMAFDEEDPTELRRRCVRVPTPFGKVFCRCVGDSSDPLLLYVHGSSSSNRSGSSSSDLARFRRT
mgnify:CR=1 FL=1